MLIKSKELCLPQPQLCQGNYTPKSTDAGSLRLSDLLRLMPDLRSDDRKQKQGNPAESRDALSVAFLPRHLNSPLGLCFPNKKHPPDTSSAYAALGGEVPQHRRVERNCTQQHSPSIRLPATHRYASVPLLTSPPASRWSKALRQDCVMLPSSFDLLLFRHLSHRVHKSWMSHSGFLSRSKWCFWGARGVVQQVPSHQLPTTKAGLLASL